MMTMEELKTATVAEAADVRMSDSVSIAPGDAVFFVHENVVGHPKFSFEDRALLSLGSVYAVSEDDVVLTELHRPNIFHWKPHAWCRNANIVLPTNVRVVVPRGCIKGKAKLAAPPTAAADEGMDHSGAFTIPPQNAHVPSPLYTVHMWTMLDLAISMNERTVRELDDLRARCDKHDLAESEAASARASLRASIEAIKAREPGARRAYDCLKNMFLQLEDDTKRTFAERDVALMEQVASVAKRVDSVEEVLRTQATSKEIGKQDAQRIDLVLGQIQEGINTLKEAQARINNDMCKSMTDLGNSLRAVETAQARFRSQLANMETHVKTVEGKIYRKSQELHRSLSALREDMESQSLAATGNFAPDAPDPRAVTVVEQPAEEVMALANVPDYRRVCTSPSSPFPAGVVPGSAESRVPRRL